jgi:hypothetical protein
LAHLQRVLLFKDSVFAARSRSRHDDAPEAIHPAFRNIDAAFPQHHSMDASREAAL